MPRTTLPLLSKSRFTSGVQCLKRLYFQSYGPGLAGATTPAQEATFEVGTAVGELARDLFPGGLLIDEDYRHHTQAVTRTTALIEAGKRIPLYEAAFTADSIRVRADIFVPAAGLAWDVIEVKSSTSVKEQYIDDAAIQVYALEHAGIAIARVCIAYINTTYIYEGGAYDLAGLFTVEDITDAARARLRTIPADLSTMRTMLDGDEPPVIDIGPHCKSPYVCEFVEHCRSAEPPWPIDELPSIAAKKVDAFRASGIRSILDLPPSAALTTTQSRVRDVVRSGEPWRSADLASAVTGFAYPIHFIDFETANPALPRYLGTRPYQVFPFQWSDHVLDAQGNLTHGEFLATGEDDPRAEFTLSLSRQLNGAGTVVVYSPYEQTQLSKLRDDLPQLREAIEAMLAIPRVDLLQVVRTHYYHPEFHGSFSLKSVLPAIAPGIGYGDLAIKDGGTAAAQFLESLDTPDAAERADIRANLLAYCARDTEAMVHTLNALIAASRLPSQ